MTAGKFRHVPVVEQGRLIGIVSIGESSRRGSKSSSRSTTRCATTSAPLRHEDNQANTVIARLDRAIQ